MLERVGSAASMPGATTTPSAVTTAAILSLVAPAAIGAIFCASGSRWNVSLFFICPCALSIYWAHLPPTRLLSKRIQHGNGSTTQLALKSHVHLLLLLHQPNQIVFRITEKSDPQLVIRHFCRQLRGPLIP